MAWPCTEPIAPRPVIELKSFRLGNGQATRAHVRHDLKRADVAIVSSAAAA